MVNGNGLGPKEVEERNLLRAYVTAGLIPNYIEANAKRLASKMEMGLYEAETLVRESLAGKLKRYGIECPGLDS